MLYEIRSYHFDPTRFEEYKVWATEEAAPYIKTQMEIVGGWLGNGMEPIYGGSVPWGDDELPVNVTWIIRWESRAQRDQAWEAFWDKPESHDVFSRVPGGFDSYFRTEVRFAEDSLF